MPPPVFVDQPSDQCGLNEQRDENQENLLTILLPHTRGPEAYLAAGRKRALADSPSLELAPIEDRLQVLTCRHGNIRRTLTIEDSHYEAGSVASNFGWTQDEATNRANSDFGFRIANDRPAGAF